MTEEMQKRIEAHAKFRYPEWVFTGYEGYQIVFYEGAKFILEMPEMNTIRNSIVEIHNLLLNYYSEPEVYWNEPDLAFIKTKELLEALKKAGLCE